MSSLKLRGCWLRAALLFVFTALVLAALTGCPQGEEGNDEDTLPLPVVLSGKITVYGVPPGTGYVVYVYEYSAAIEDTSGLESITTLLSPLATGFEFSGGGKISTITLVIAETENADFTFDGAFLVVIRAASGENGDSGFMRYQSEVPFIGGTATLDYENMDGGPAPEPEPEPDPPVIIFYTVTFDLNYTGAANPAIKQEVDEGVTAKKPDDPTRTGYIFGGWFTASGTEWDFKTLIVRDITLYARWTPITYKVSFDTGGVSPTPTEQSVQYGGYASPPANMKDGYALDGWYTTAARTGPEWDFGTDAVTTDTVLYGTWTQNFFIVRFDLAYTGAPKPEERQVVAGRLTARPDPAPQRTGYTFGGWFTEAGEEWNFTTAITGSITLYAKWTQIKYTVSFNTWPDGSAVAAQTVAHGSAAAKPADPTREGYIFGGWYANSTLTVLFDFTASITGDTIVYARWVLIKFTVTFDTGGVEPVPKPQAVQAYGDKISAPTDTKADHALDGWYKETAKTTRWDFDTDTVQKNTILYGTWTRNAHTVTFNTGGVEPTPLPLPAVPYDSTITAPTMTKTGYTFDGWYKEAAKTTKWNFSTDTVKENISLYGTWIKSPIVTFFVDGVVNKTVEVPLGDKATQPTDITPTTGHTLDGWYTTAAYAAKWDFNSTVTADIGLYARWVPVTYTVSFNTGGVTPTPASLSAPYGGTIAEPVITKTDYTVDGWYKDTAKTAKWTFARGNGNNNGVTPDTVTGNITLYGEWVPVTFAAAVADMAANKGAASKTYSLHSSSSSEQWTSVLVLTAGVNSPVSVTIDGSGRSVTGSGNRITVGAGVTMTLKNITLAKIPITVASSGVLIMDTGTEVYGNLEAGASGITVNTGAIFEMRGGGVKSVRGVPGVAVSGSFTMSGGEISYSGATGITGGGVQINDGTFTMSAGTIKENFALNGGGVGVTGGAMFTMSGGTISGNTTLASSAGVSSSGGGVMVTGTNSRFAMTGGTISGNDADSDGGGVNVMAGSTFNMTGGEITGNIAAGNGGGVFLYAGSTFTGNPRIGNPVTSGTGSGWIYGNTATQNPATNDLSN